MIIKRITLENFRQYKDPVEINFSSDPQKNVTVFTGDNNRGKSTLIQAFVWAIYNKDRLDLDDPTNILNIETQKHLQPREKATVSVEVVLTHREVEYTFLRTQTYVCIDPNKVRPTDERQYSVWYTENNQKKRSTEPITTREKILPEDLADYFFFDGEHLKKLKDRKNLKLSIAKLLGLLPLQNAVKDLNKVEMAIANSLPRGGNEALTKALSRVKQASAAIESQETQKSYIEPALNKAQTDYNEYQQKLSDIKLTANLIEQRETQKKILQNKSELAENQLIDCSKKFNNVFYNVLLSDLIDDSKQLMDQIEKENLANEAIPHMHADSIKYILERGKCICGTDLQNHPELIEHIKQLGNLLPPHSIGTEVATFASELDIRSEAIPQNIDSFNDVQKAYYAALKEVDRAQNTLNELNTQLEGVDDIAIDEIRKKYQESENDLKRYQRQLNDIESNLKMFKRDLKTAQDEVNRIMSLDEMYNKPRICAKYAAQLANEIDQTRAIKEANMLEDFRKVLDEVFTAMYHGEREVYVDENFNVHLYIPEYGDASTSEGTKSVLGFAYVCTLLKLALDQLDDPELASEPHALVMDAPTSAQDEKHIPKVFKYTISVANQIILFINNKDWQYVKPAIESKIDKVYELKRINEVVTEIKVMQ